MVNKRKVTKKQMLSLGLRKTENGDYDYIDSGEKERSKYKPIRKESK
ncbi:hypothetical protein [uncultured Clostridium sp.]|nr:hypothetical protein [uncultured Clostridium sp.]